ncbi:MAG: hypothetical protein EOP09_01285 [Proteobacteria bacterium]|nr:MAG: hypothetical protein EOP09_01285 [Pseudomonadota bacterium]
MTDAQSLTVLSDFWTQHSRSLDLYDDYKKSVEVALKTNEWNTVALSFLSKKFIGPTGEFLLVGNYRTLRHGIERIEPLGLKGRILSTFSTQTLLEIAAEVTGFPVK